MPLKKSLNLHFFGRVTCLILYCVLAGKMTSKNQA
jgi:hypothetical protein